MKKTVLAGESELTGFYLSSFLLKKGCRIFTDEIKPLLSIHGKTELVEEGMSDSESTKKTFLNFNHILAIHPVFLMGMEINNSLLFTSSRRVFGDTGMHTMRTEAGKECVTHKQREMKRMCFPSVSITCSLSVRFLKTRVEKKNINNTGGRKNEDHHLHSYL